MTSELQGGATSADIATLRRQLMQLQALHEQGVLGDDSYQASRATLERRIVDAVIAGGDLPAAAAVAAAPAAATATTAKRPGLGLWLGLGAAVVVIGAAGYMWTGRPAMTSAPESMAAAPAPNAPASAPHALDFGQVGEMASRLAEKLKKNPDDAQGWVMLARSYSVLGKRAEAVPAYERAVKLVPDDAGLLADYADALAVSSDTRMAGKPTELVDRALKLDPDHVKALSLAGTAAFERKDYKKAVERWEHILQVAPPDSPYVPQVRESLKEARQLAGLPAQADPVVTAAPAAASATPTAGATGAAGATVSGSVTLAKALAAQAQPDDTVFIFARAAEGPRMPLAVLRKQVKDLPLTFSLDDSMAMSPAMRLSAFAKVVISARVSKSGNAIQQPGDLLGQTEAVSLGASNLRIEISQAVAK